MHYPTIKQVTIVWIMIIYEEKNIFYDNIDFSLDFKSVGTCSTSDSVFIYEWNSSIINQSNVRISQCSNLVRELVTRKG